MARLFGRRPRTEAGESGNELDNLCTGDCLRLKPLLSKPASQQYHSMEDSEELSRKARRFQEDSMEVIWRPILSSQTRLIRIPPSLMQQTSADATTLNFELVAADVIATEGLRAVDSPTENASYIALSYCWSHQPGANSISKAICNDNSVFLSEKFISAIRYHQKPDSFAYLWIDAICINQRDNAEKSRQVTVMLDIYMKSSSVTAWLGLPEADSGFALSCLHQMRELVPRIGQVQGVKHNASCQQIMQHLLTALLAFYERPYFTRTWIRQETYAAKSIVVVSGRQTTAWETLLEGDQLFQPLLQCVGPIDAAVMNRLGAIGVWVTEGSINMHLEISNRPPPRDLLEVLLHSVSYQVSQQEDTIYAILGMCGIPTTTSTSDWKPTGREFLVDYERTSQSNRAFHDLTLWLLARPPEYYCLPFIWNYYTKPGGRDIPRWVMHWRSSRCGDEERSLIDEMIGSTFVHADRSQSERSARWCPLDHNTPIHSVHVKVSEIDERTLELRGRAINYVAYISDFSCSVQSFLDLGSDPMRRSPLGASGETIHMHGDPLLHQGLFSFSTDILEPLANEHDRRIAILGCGIDWQFAMVPKETRKGDIVVAVGPSVLPIILSPTQYDMSRSGLYSSNDSYGHCLFTPEDIRGVPWFHYLTAPGLWTTRKIIFSVLVPGTLILLGLALLLIAVVRSGTPNKPLLYSGATLLVLGFAVGVAWVFCATFIVRLQWPELHKVRPHIALRIRNFNILDGITTNAHRFRFVGPVLVRQGGPFVHNKKAPLTQPSDSVADRPLQTFFVE